jgi:hypothetical protein
MYADRRMVTRRAALALILLAGCGSGKPAESGGLADESVTPSNVDVVKHFPDETATHDSLSIEWRAAPLRAAPPDGPLVAILTRGNGVTAVAKRGDFFLVTFKNPDNPVQRWSGWAHKNVFAVGTEPYPPMASPQRCTRDEECKGVRCAGVASLGPIGLDGYRFCSVP